ncbi:MAG: polyphosphate polymerase domain-containing protein [Clostridia bacterium]|nr:polyphosphate polymerase domain-containing protein [Clostridia bacterium]MBQ7897751.1 polyphosphate polymerase domain-containing protein [Clostridia bacterium]
MQFRHEVKHEINEADMLILRQRLKAVMSSDPHAVNGKYEIRSLYFDTLDDKALREKLDGVNIREKYRIRLYNNDPSVIHLERKFKHGGLGYKSSVSLSPKEAQAIADGDVEWMARSNNEALLGFYLHLRNEGLKAKVIVDYTREPFIFAPGNVRITLDYGIRTSMSCTDFLNPNCVTVPIKESPCILEVKWDSFLPDVIRDAVQLEGRHSAAFSKYAACRMYD